MTSPATPPSVLPAETVAVRFGGQFARGKFHIVDLPEAAGPWRKMTDFHARCGADHGGSSLSSADLTAMLAVEESTGRSLICKRCAPTSNAPASESAS